MVPYCRRLIDHTLLTPKEKKWLNDYHTTIREKTKAFFVDDELSRKWLERETQPIS
jgi:Xaa-Pro aminopeptidase